MNENRKKIIIYIVLFLLLLAVIFGVLMLTQKKSSSTTTSEPNKNLFGYFTKNKQKNSSDDLSNGTTIVNTDGNITSGNGTILNNGSNSSNQGNNSTNNGTSGQNGSGTGTNSGNGTGNNTGGGTGIGTGGGTTTFTTGGGGTTLNNVTVDIKTGLPIDVKGPTNTGGGTGLPIGTTTGNCIVDPHGDLQYIVKEPQGDVLFSEFGELITDGRVFPPDPFGISVNAQSMWGDTKYKKIKKCIPAAVCNAGDVINYRVAQPQGDVLFAEDGELISDDRNFPPNTLSVSTMGLWGDEKYRKIRQCIPQSNTNTTITTKPFISPLDIGSNVVLDACKKLENVNKTDISLDEKRDCVLYRTWNVWTYPDNYIKDPRWDEENLDRAKFQSLKTKIRTEFNNIIEKISSERSLSNATYDLKNLTNHKKILYQLINDCIRLKETLIGVNGVGGLWNGKWSHAEAARQLAEKFKDYTNENFRNAVKSVYVNGTVTDSSLLGTPNATFKEINFTNGNQLSTSPFAKLYELINIKAYKTADLIIGPSQSNNPGGGIMLLPSNYQTRQPQNFPELYAQDERLSLFCKLTTAGFFYTHKASSTSQNIDNHLLCDNSSTNHTTDFSGDNPDTSTKENQLPAYVYYNHPSKSNDIDIYGTDSQNNWYRVTKPYLLYKLFKVN